MLSGMIIKYFYSCCIKIREFPEENQSTSAQKPCPKLIQFTEKECMKGNLCANIRSELMDITCSFLVHETSCTKIYTKNWPNSLKNTVTQTFDTLLYNKFNSVTIYINKTN